MSINKVIIIGHLTRDPEILKFAKVNLCKFGIAVNSGKKGSDSEEVCFIDVSVWGDNADTCAKYLSKGKLVAVDGRLKLETWEGKEGKKNSKHVLIASKVDFLFPKEDDSRVDNSRVNNSRVEEPRSARMYTSNSDSVLLGSNSNNDNHNLF